MNFNHLKYFVDAASEESISKSAKKNFVTQSAVSRAIKCLESELNSRLVIHRQNNFQLTEVGQAIFRESRSIFSAIDSLKEVAESYYDTFRGPLRFACNQAIASHLVGPVLANIEAAYPQLDVLMKLGNTDQVQEMIDRREIDFAIVLNDGEVGKKYRVSNFFEDDFLVVRSPLLKEKYNGENLLVSRTKKGGMSTRYFREFKKAYGKVIEPKGVFGSWQVILDLALSGFGFALAPRFVCKENLRRRSLSK